MKDINPHQLRFLRAIGATESSWDRTEAYSERYNQAGNNANVGRIGAAGADYGYFQNNAQQVKEAVEKYGIPYEIARHLNGGGQGGKSSPEEQTQAMHMYLQKRWPKLYEGVKSGDPQAIAAAAQAMSGTWFGIRDRWHSRETQSILQGKTTSGMTSDGAPTLGPGTSLSGLQNARQYLERQLQSAPETDRPRIQQQLDQVNSLHGQLQQQIESRRQQPSTGPVGDMPQAGDTSGLGYNRYSKTGIHPGQVARDIIPVDTAFGKIRVHRDSAEAFQGFLGDLKAAGAPFSKFGSYNVRQKRWSSGWSEHSYGNALDMDDTLGLTPAQKRWLADNKETFDSLKRKWGMVQGMPHDPNHIEFGGVVSPEARDQIEAKRQTQQDQSKGQQFSFRTTSPYTEGEVQELQRRAGGGQNAIIGFDPKQQGADRTLAAAEAGQSPISLYHMGPGMPGFDKAEDQAIARMNAAGGWEKDLMATLGQYKGYRFGVQHEVDNLDQFKTPEEKAAWVKQHLAQLREQGINSRLALKNFTAEDIQALQKAGIAPSDLARVRINENSMGPAAIEAARKAGIQFGIPGEAITTNTRRYQTDKPATIPAQPSQQGARWGIVDIPRTGQLGYRKDDPGIPSPTSIRIAVESDFSKANKTRTAADIVPEPTPVVSGASPQAARGDVPSTPPPPNSIDRPQSINSDPMGSGAAEISQSGSSAGSQDIPPREDHPEAENSSPSGVAAGKEANKGKGGGED